MANHFLVFSLTWLIATFPSVAFAGLIKSESVLKMVSNSKNWDIEVPDSPVKMTDTRNLKKNRVYSVSKVPGLGRNCL